MIRFVIAYDIRDDRRRLEVFNILKGYATRVQYSVFEAYLSKENMVELRYRIGKAINEKEDSVFIYRLCQSCSEDVERIGIPFVLYGEGDIII